MWKTSKSPRKMTMSMSLMKLTLHLARSADVMSKAERLADSAVVETDAELAPNVLTLSNTVLGTSEKVAELVWNVDEFDSAGSAELIDVAVDEEQDELVNDEILDFDEEIVNTELEDNRSIAGVNASSTVGLAAVTLFDEDKDVM
jgi:hypothetical protein